MEKKTRNLNKVPSNRKAMSEICFMNYSLVPRPLLDFRHIVFAPKYILYLLLTVEKKSPLCEVNQREREREKRRERDATVKSWEWRGDEVYSF